jgi:hypothetical protein
MAGFAEQARWNSFLCCDYSAIAIDTMLLLGLFRESIYLALQPTGIISRDAGGSIWDKVA